MLIALNGEQELTLASDVSRESARRFTCPCCNTAVVYKMGTRTIPHFAHKSLIDCHTASENESPTHMTGKLDIFKRISKVSTSTKLEQYFEDINQRADIGMEHRGVTYAFEFQCSNLAVTLLSKRTSGYKSVGVTPIWIFNSDFLKRNHDKSFKINAMVQSAIASSATLFFYDVKRKRVIRISEIIPFSRMTFFGNEVSTPIKDLTLDFFENTKNERMKFYNEWGRKWTRYVNGIRYEGLKNDFHMQLYQSGMYIQNLPPYIGLPLRNNFLFSTPPIEWQGILFIEFVQNDFMTKSEIIDLWNCKMNNGQIVPSEATRSNQLNLNNALYEFMSALLFTGFASKGPKDVYTFKDKNFNGVPYEKLVKFLSATTSSS